MGRLSLRLGVRLLRWFEGMGGFWILGMDGILSNGLGKVLLLSVVNL